MLWRILAKLLLKASVSLVLLAGVLSYGHYLRGGDPASLWKGIAARASDQVAGLFSVVRDDASKVAGVLTRGSLPISGGEAGEDMTQVYTWKDAKGVTHYSTEAPTGVMVKTISVDPNVNVLAPVRAPVAVERRDSNAGQMEDGQVPGVAGQVLSTRGDGSASAGESTSGESGNASEGSGIDPAQLLRMIQAAER